MARKIKANGNQKGKAGEREAVALLRKYGFEARRGQQYSGGGDSPDVVHNIPSFHIEVKRTETLSLYNAVAQANNDIQKDAEMLNKPWLDKSALVLHRRNNKPWLAIVEAEVFLDFMRKYKDLLKEKNNGIA